MVTNEERGAYLATEYLISLGHRRIDHISGPPGWLGTTARVRGWSAALSAAGLPSGSVVAGDWTTASGYEAGSRLGEAGGTAVFAANDQMALGCIAAIVDSGRSVPGDISVVGFDDLPVAGYVLPALTTVRFDFAEVGRRAVDHILDLMAGRNPGPADSIEPVLIIRDSTQAMTTS